MTFTTLQQRLLAHVRQRIRAGELTERGLARLIGVSQPHVHNVLKGVRALTPDTADLVMVRLRLSVQDLLDSEYGGAGVVWVPLLEGSVGPGQRFAALRGQGGFNPFPGALLRGTEDAVAARLAADPVLLPLFAAADLVLLDRSPAPRDAEDPGYYLLDVDGEALLRRVERTAGGVRLHGAGGQFLSLPGRNILDLVKAKAIWMGRHLESPPVAAGSNQETG